MTKTVGKMVAGGVLGCMAAAALGAAALCGGCGDGRNLYMYTWSDYFDPELLAEFEREHGCTVVVDTFDSNESAFAKLSAGARGYDLITPTSYFVPAMAAAGIVTNVDMSLLPNVAANFDARYSRFLLSTNFEHSVPYAFSMTGVMYRKDAVPEGFDPSKEGWGVLTNPVFRSRVSIFNDPREVIGCSLRENGHSVNSADAAALAEALETAKALKRSSLKMDNEMYKMSVVAGEIAASMGYSSDAMQAAQECDKVGFAVPATGTTCCFDEFCIAAGARSPDLAHAFIDFMYEPSHAARNIEYICSIMPVSGVEALVDPGMDNRDMVFPPDEVLSRCELLRTATSDAAKAYSWFWDELKASK